MRLQGESRGGVPGARYIFADPQSSHLMGRILLLFFVCEVTPAGLSRLQYFGHRLGAICIRVCSPVDLSGALPPP